MSQTHSQHNTAPKTCIFVKVSDLSMVHVHVGRVVAGHVEAQGVVARRRTSLGRFSEAGSAIREPDLQEGKCEDKSNLFKRHLYPRLTELGPLTELLPGVDIWVLGPLERLLQLVQLVGRERGARPPLLALVMWRSVQGGEGVQMG